MSFRGGRRKWVRQPRRALSYEVKNGVVQAKLLERHVVREIIDRLWFQAKIKVWIINQPVGGKTPQNEAGIPDLMGWIPKRPGTVKCPGLYCGKTIVDLPATPLFIEVKRPGGVRSLAQERFIAEARSGGCCAFFAESWDDVIREFSNVGVVLKTID